MAGDLSDLYKAILEGDPNVAKQEVEQALARGDDPSDVLDVMVRGMDEVGHLFEEGEYFVPEMLIAARAMKAAIALLNPSLGVKDLHLEGTVVAGTVKGDLHDIGKNLVCVMLKGAGLRVIDLGVDVSPHTFVTAVKEHHPDLLVLSASLTSTMPNLAQTMDALQKAGVRDEVKVLVGGNPLDISFAEEIGADGYATNAKEAVVLAQALL